MGFIYFVFWSISSVAVMALVGLGYFYLMQLLKDIKQKLRAD